MFKASATLEVIRKARVMAILRWPDAAQAESAMLAAIDGGFQVLEVTLGVPDAPTLIAKLAARSNVLVGAGTVLTSDDVKRVVDAGARFVVSPIVDEVVIQACLDLDVVCVPGCATPTEMVRAQRAGAHLQKLFPAPASGPVWLRQVLGPLPFLRIVPTAGVSPENVVPHLEAGAFAAGLVSSLFVPDDVREERWDAIRSRAQAVFARLAQAFTRPSGSTP